MAKSTKKSSEPTDMISSGKISSEPADLEAFLASTELFGALDASLLQRVAAELQPRQLLAGAVLASQGDPCEFVTIVRQGRLQEVTAFGLRTQQIINEVGVGESTGLDNQLWSATIVAVVDTEVVNLPKATLERLVESEPLGAPGGHPSLQQAIDDQTRRQQLRIALRNTQLFNAFDPAILRTLEAEMTRMTLESGEILMRQGDPSDGMYVVISGRLRVVAQLDAELEKVLGELSHGDNIGSMTFLTGQTRTGTVFALEGTEVAKLPLTIFERLASTSPEIVNTLQHAITAMMRRRQLHSVLSETNVLSELDPALLRDLQAELTWLSLVSGQTLLQQGEPGDCMYIIISGRVRVVREGEGEETRTLREVGRGETIGEVGLLSGQPRPATAYAIRDTEVAKLTKESFEQLLDKYPVAMLQTFIRRIVNIVLAEEAGSPPSGRQLSLSVAIISTHPDVILTDFTHRLVKAFAKLGPTLHVNSTVVDRMLGAKGIAQTDIDAWDELDIQLVGFLSEMETDYPYIVYEADPTPTPWTQRCIRQADQILIVGQAKDSPAPGKVELELRRLATGRMRKKTSLVLLHRDGYHAPEGTLQWLAVRQVDQHHHIRWNRDADFERLARIVGGRAVGLVLGGGGARGAAHIGVIRALQEAGIPIDIVGGTSAGSIISALYAIDGDIQTMIDRFRPLLGTTLIDRARDSTLPIVALSSGYSVTQALKKLFGERQIEDLWLPYFCVSTNLTHAEPVVFRSGLLRQAARASSTIPGFNPPVVVQGELLIDGALLNNLPMNSMREFCGGGTVIAVDVTPPIDLAEIEPYGDELSGWQVAWERINPLERKGSMPSMAALLYRTIEVGIVHELKTQIGAKVADLYVRPPVEQFGLVATDAMEEIAEIGYQCAREKIAQWQAYPVALESMGKSAQ